MMTARYRYFESLIRDGQGQVELIEWSSES